MREIYVTDLRKCAGGWEMEFYNTLTLERWTKRAKRKRTLIVAAFLNGYHFNECEHYESLFN
jgi:hypothetical protein